MLVLFYKLKSHCSENFLHKKCFVFQKLSLSKLDFVHLTTYMLSSEHFYNTGFLPLQLSVRKILLMKCNLEGKEVTRSEFFLPRLQFLRSCPIVIAYRSPLPQAHICPFFIDTQSKQHISHALGV